MVTKIKWIKTIVISICFGAAGIATADIEEIIVTALKRETTLQETPLSVSVMSAETIEQSAIVDFFDFANSVPSFKTTQLQQSGQTNFWIRGYTNGANDPGISPSVAVYVDGAPRMRAINALSDLPDTERIEILKGPQSTLFGKNASAGVVNVTTKAPTGQSERLLEMTIGNYSATTLKGMLGGALNETTSYRFAFNRNKRDGFIDNIFNDTALNNKDRWAIRGQLLSEFNDSTSVRLIVEADSLDELCCAQTQISKSAFAGITDDLATVTVPAVTDRYDLDRRVAFNIDPTNEIDNRGVTLIFNSDLGFADLNAVVSKRSGEMDANADVDQSTADWIKQQQLQYDFDVNTIEVRLSSNTDGRVAWTAGMFYSDEDMKVYRDLLYGPDMATFIDLSLKGATTPTFGLGIGLKEIASAVTLQGLAPLDPNAGQAAALAAITNLGLPQTTSPTVLGMVGAQFIEQTYIVNHPVLGPVPLSALIEGQQAGYFNDGGGDLGENFHQQNETLSIFANVEIDLTEQLRLGVGFNFTDNSIESTGTVTTDDNFADLPFESDPTLALLSPFAFFPSYTSFGGPGDSHDGRSDDDAFTHTIKLSYDVTENMMVYASHSTGYKPKVLNMIYSASGGVTDALGEDATSVEFGFKTSFEGGFLNIAIFDHAIENFQINQFVGGGFNLVNAEEERHRGIELDSVFAVNENLVVGLSLAKIDAEYETYTEGPCLDAYYDYATPAMQALTYATSCQATGEDWSGFTPAGVPSLAGNINVTYSWGTDDRGGYARIEYYHEDEYALTDALTVAAASRKQNDFNASVGINRNDMSIRLWGRNLTDNSYLVSAATTPATLGSFFGYQNMPRTYGLTVSKTF